MKLRFALIAAVVLALSVAGPAAANHQLPFTVVDRNAVSLVYVPQGAGSSLFAGSVSYQFGPTWDLLLSFSSQSGPSASAFRAGGRFHLRPPARGIDPFATLQYASEDLGGVTSTAILAGFGISAQVAPNLDVFGTLTYHSDDQIVYYDYGLKYDVGQRFSIIGGINTTWAYLGVAMSFR